MRIAFVETMRGFLTPTVGPSTSVDFNVRAEGALDGHCTLAGVVHAPPWVDETTCEGTLDLSLRALAYDVRFAAADGRALRLHGKKRPSLLRPLRSMTVLPIQLDDAQGNTLATGELEFDLMELPEFMASWLPRPTKAHRKLEARRISIERTVLSEPVPSGAEGRSRGPADTLTAADPNSSDSPVSKLLQTVLDSARTERGLTGEERAQLTLLATTALPAGRLLPGASEDTVRRLEQFFTEVPPSLLAGYRALVRTLDAESLVLTRKRFAQLPYGRRVEVLERMEQGEATRLALRGLLTPLKLAHFDDPKVYAALGCRYVVDPPLGRERARWSEQVLDASALPEGEDLECDVVVVGTGAGGAPMAKALAERGHAVLLVEEGQHHTRKDFNGRAVQMMKKLYRQGGATVAFGNTAIPIPVGRGVGGTTLINSGTCFRLPPEVLASWRAMGLGAFKDDALSPFYEQVEDVLGVGPSSAAALGAPARVIARGCDALGWSHHALLRNAPGCDGQGLCCFGCPSDAKRSTNVSYVPLALERGAQLVTGFKVERVLTEHGAAVGVRGVSTERGTPVTVRAKVVVLACGTLGTPVLLERSGLCGTSGQLGQHLSIHPASAGIGVFDEDLDASRTVPQGYAIDQFKHEGLYFEGAQVPLDLTAASLSGSGPAFVSLMEQFHRSFGFGFMVKDTSRGSVHAGPDGEPRLRYSVNEHDRALLQRGFALLSRVYFAAGAKEVRLPVLGFERLRGLADVERLERAHVPARHMDLTAYHPLGTARMGVAPLTSVVDDTHEAHDVRQLFITDGSAVPSSLGVNPQLTLMAMSLRAAEFVHRRLERFAERKAA